MVVKVDIRELPTRLDELLEMASKGHEVLLLDGTEPRAKLTPVQSPPREQRIPGLHKGVFQVSPDFDDPLPDAFWLGEE